MDHGLVVTEAHSIRLENGQLCGEAQSVLVQIGLADQKPGPSPGQMNLAGGS